MPVEPKIELPDDACKICGKATESASGDPSAWPVRVTRRDGSGLLWTYHHGCVAVALAQLHELRAASERYRSALEYIVVLDNLYLGNDFKSEPKGSNAAHVADIADQMATAAEGALNPAPQPVQAGSEGVMASEVCKHCGEKLEHIETHVECRSWTHATGHYACNQSRPLQLVTYAEPNANPMATKSARRRLLES